MTPSLLLLLAVLSPAAIWAYRTIHRGTLCECNHFNNYWFSVVTAIQRYAELERSGGLMDPMMLAAVENDLPITCEPGGPTTLYDMEMVPMNVSTPVEEILEAGRTEFWPLVWLSKFCVPGQAALMALCSWKRALQGDIEGVASYMVVGAELMEYGLSCMTDHNGEDLPLNATVAFLPLMVELIPGQVLSALLRGELPLSLQDIVIDPSRDEKYANTAYRACIPLQVNHQCWPSIAWTTHDSCEMYTPECCDPDIEEKASACGKSMRKCCNLPEEAEIHQPTSPIRLLHDSPPPWDEFQRLRSSLRDWRRVGCMWPRLVEMYLSNEREDEKKKKDDDVWTKARNIGILSNKEEAFDETFKNWWQNSEDHQRLFPHEDVWAIKGPVCFNLDTAEWSTELDIADGIEVAEALHGVCGEGMPLREVTSCTLDGALLPDREGVNYTPTEKTPMDSYSLTLMRTRQSPPPSNQTIRRRGLAVLMGQLSSNIWHFSQDYTWLWKLIQLGVLNDSITNAYTKVWLVETKYAAAECEVDGKRCWHSDGGIPGPKDLWQMMVHKLVLSSNLVAKSVESIHSFTDGKRLLRDGIKHVCYDGAIQPWRAWPSGKQYYDTLRETVVAACGLHDTGLTRKVVLLERGSRHRRWSAETATEMTEMITDWGRLNAFTVGWVRPGGLDPCNQVGTLANAAVIIGIGGADMANLLWAPRGAILIEVDAGCYLTTSALSSNGSAYRSHVCRNGQSGVRKQHCHPSAQPFPWRGPGLDYKGEHYNRAKRIYDEAVADERCIDPAETPPPQSTFSADGYRAEFARVKGLAYSAIHRCDCHEPRGHDYDCYHSWLQGEISIDVKGTLMPLLNTLVHDYLLYAFDLE